MAERTLTSGRDIKIVFATLSSPSLLSSFDLPVPFVRRHFLVPTVMSCPSPRSSTLGALPPPFLPIDEETFRQIIEDIRRAFRRAKFHPSVDTGDSSFSSNFLAKFWDSQGTFDHDDRGVDNEDGWGGSEEGDNNEDEWDESEEGDDGDYHDENSGNEEDEEAVGDVREETPENLVIASRAGEETAIDHARRLLPRPPSVQEGPMRSYSVQSILATKRSRTMDNGEHLMS